MVFSILLLFQKLSNDKFLLLIYKRKMTKNASSFQIFNGFKQRLLYLVCNKSISTSSSAHYSLLEVPNEDIPPVKIKTPVDLRLKKSHHMVYGAGLCLTGSLASPHLIEMKTAPEIITKPLRIGAMNGHKIKKVSAGFGFSLFASSTELYGSGLNNYYQIGGPKRKSADQEDEEKEEINSNPNTSKEWYIRAHRIILPEDCGKIKDISSGRLHSLISTENALFAMGDNVHGQCGMNPQQFPLAVVSRQNKWKKIQLPNTESHIRSVHCCLDTSFVLLNNGELYSFGLGTDGQLGNAKGRNEQAIWQPTLLGGDLQGVKVSRISGSTDTLVAVSTDGELFMWGQNEYGQMNIVSEEPQVFYPQHIPLKNLGKIVCAAATGSSVLICNSDGLAFSWGSEFLGLGPKIQQLDRPMQLDPPLFSSAMGDDGKVKWVYGGNLTMGAVTEAGHLFTWGSNRHGSLALGHPKNQYFPYQTMSYNEQNLFSSVDNALDEASSILKQMDEYIEILSYAKGNSALIEQGIISNNIERNNTKCLIEELERLLETKKQN